MSKVAGLLRNGETPNPVHRRRKEDGMRRYAALSTALTVSQSLCFTMNASWAWYYRTHASNLPRGLLSPPCGTPLSLGALPQKPQPKLAALDRLAERRLS